MKLLLLTPQLPYPPHQGTTIRNFNIIKHLVPRHAITLVSFGTAEELANAEPLRALCQRIEIAPYPTRSMMQRAWTTLTSPLPDMALRLKSDAMHAMVERVLREEQFDIVQIEGIEMARYAINLKSQNSKLKIVFDDHNAEYVLQRTAFQADVRHPRRWHAALYSLIQWKKLERYERTVCRYAHHIVACSQTDAQLLSTLTPTLTLTLTLTPTLTLALHSSLSIIPNGVDTEYFVPSDAICAKPNAEFGLVFVGKMDFRPNIDAMTWFVAEILPRIRTALPLAHLVIVGQKPASRIQALAQNPGVAITGWVPDTRPFVADAAVYVVPLRMGSGTRLKVLEAMAMGKAIVSTTRGVEGIACTPNHDLLLADTPDTFARAVIDLLRNPARRRELGRNARTLVESKYDWREIIPQFDHVYACSKQHPE